MQPIDMDGLKPDPTQYGAEHAASSEHGKQAQDRYDDRQNERCAQQGDERRFSREPASDQRTGQWDRQPGTDGRRE